MYIFIILPTCFVVLWSEGPMDSWHHFVSAVSETVEDLFFLHILYRRFLW